jgi:hypothetical protein
MIISGPGDHLGQSTPEGGEEAMSKDHIEAKGPKPKPTEIEINGELILASDDEMRVADLLALDGKTPGEYYLIELRGKHEQDEHRDADEVVRLRKGLRFITMFLGATTVS